jgi:hypothetical protein
MSAYFAGAAALLRLLRSLTLPKLLFLNLVPAAALGFAYGHDRVDYGMAHAIEEGLRVLGWSFPCFVLGTLAWWVLHRRFSPRPAAPSEFAA